MRWKFDERRMNKFVRWIKEPKNKDKISDYCYIQKLKEWMKQDKINNAEDKIWAIFLYTCIGGLGVGRKLYELIPDRRKLGENWKEKIQEAFKDKSISLIDHRKRVMKRIPKHEAGGKFLRELLQAEATIDAIKSYDEKLIGDKSQQQFFESSREKSDRFDYLFEKIKKEVNYFGRLAAWDFLDRVDRCRILDFEIVPNRLYLKGATGPKKGFEYITNLSNKELARLSNEELQKAEKKFCEEVKKRLGRQMDIRDTETSLCNFQKEIPR